jgi:hypothetical protein
VHGSNFVGSGDEVKQHWRDIGHADAVQQKSPIGAADCRIQKDGRMNFGRRSPE